MLTTSKSKLEIRALQFPKLLTMVFDQLSDKQFESIAGEMKLSVDEVKYIFELAEEDYGVIEKLIAGDM